MNVYIIFAIGIRIFSFALIYTGIKQLPLVYEVAISSRINGLSASELYIFLTFLLPVGVALLLWLFPVYFAKKIAGPSLDKNFEKFSPFEISTIAVYILGLYMLIMTLPNLLYDLTLLHYYVVDPNLSSRSGVGPETKGHVVATLFQLMAGLLLIFRSRSISGLVSKVGR